MLRHEIEPRGEPPIHLNKLSALPADAKRVLHIGSEVRNELKRKRAEGWSTPVNDLPLHLDKNLIEESREDLIAEGSRVVNSIVFMFPNIVLRILAQFDFHQRVEL